VDKTREREREREREKKADIKQFYTGSSHNIGVVQSLALSRDFTIITHDYKLLYDPSKRLLCLRLSCSSTTSKDFLAIG